MEPTVTGKPGCVQQGETEGWRREPAVGEWRAGLSLEMGLRAVGIPLAAMRGMTIELRSQTTGRVCKIPPKAFGKLLHLARFHGWEPEQIAGEWPSTSWDTEIILPHVGAYMTGSVSEEDALKLAQALERVIDSESSGLDQKLYFAALGVLEIAKKGEFDVAFESALV